MCGCEGACACVCVCQASLYAGQFLKKMKMIVLRNSLLSARSVLLVVGTVVVGKCSNNADADDDDDNDDVQSFGVV